LNLQIILVALNAYMMSKKGINIGRPRTSMQQNEWKWNRVCKKRKKKPAGDRLLRLIPIQLINNYIIAYLAFDFKQLIPKVPDQSQ